MLNFNTLAMFFLQQTWLQRSHSRKHIKKTKISTKKIVLYAICKTK
uniref:Uncharacterized protein n=1 Tax=Anguilla anguilla TaxID=7936 RepID=A0A0E9PKN1_ANGAN